MNQLNYGWNVGDLAAYPIQPLSLIDKVGGPYLSSRQDQTLSVDEDDDHTEETTDTEEGKEMTSVLYYLVSLDRQSFHQFNPMILKNNSGKNFIELDRLVQTSVFKIMKKTKAFEQVFHEVIKQHRTELEPFFQKPIEQNSACQSYVFTAFEKVVAFHLSKGQTSNLARFFAMSSLNVTDPPLEANGQKLLNSACEEKEEGKGEDQTDKSATAIASSNSVKKT